METFNIYYKLENRIKVCMKKYKNKFKNYLVQNQKGLFKNLQHLSTNLLSTDLDYKQEASANIIQKHPTGISMVHHT